MAVHQVDLIRGYVLRKMRDLKIYISMLPTREEDALRALDGNEGMKTACRIADFVLEQFGHEAPKTIKSDSPTLRAARKVSGG